MMGQKDGQMQMVIMDLGELVPQNHLLKRIDSLVSFDFIYEMMAPYYSQTGRPSIDPVCMVKMLLVGYLYGVKSERRLMEEVHYNLAYRWFCGFDLMDSIPNHSTFSKNRVFRWRESGLFEEIFLRIVRQCVDMNLVNGENMVADGSYIPANVSRDSWIDIETCMEKSMNSYLDALDAELANQPGFRVPEKRQVVETHTTSTTDPECGFIHHGTKRGIGYLLEATTDCKAGILTGIDVYPANQKESLIILRHLEKQMHLSGLQYQKIALDRGYDTGAVHRGLELLGITGYMPPIEFSNSPQKYGFTYVPEDDLFLCPKSKPLKYYRLNCNRSTGKYLRCYQTDGATCTSCSQRPNCFDKTGKRRRILASSCYPAFHRGHERVGTPKYYEMMRKRKIWSEGSFSVLKREHLISKIRKRGIRSATEECLLAASALNLKRMVKAIFFSFYRSMFLWRINKCCA